MIYRVMKNASFDMTAPTFGKWSGGRASSAQGKDHVHPSLSATAMVKEAGHYAGLAVLSADPGFTAVSGGITSPFRAWFDEPFNQSIRAWFAAPFQLRIQDCEAAFRRVAATNLSATAVPTGAPIFVALQASATPQTAASSAPLYFTGGTSEAAGGTGAGSGTVTRRSLATRASSPATSSALGRRNHVAPGHTGLGEVVLSG
jgi:hypothetical protein